MSSEICSRYTNNGREYFTEGTDDSKYKDKSKPKTTFVLPPKKFEYRRSLLIAQMEDNIHFRAGYNIIVSFSLFLMLALNFKEYVQHGRLSSAIYFVIEKFGKLHIVLLLWIANNLSTFLCYNTFMLWAKLRQKVPSQKVFDKLCIVALVSYYGATFYLIPCLISYFNLPFGSSAILLGEGVRFLMKVHAFVRDNAPKVLSDKPEERNMKLPTFSQYANFLYLPTAIYRDAYPRTNKTRWSYVTLRSLELLWAMACIAHIYIYIVNPIFKDVCAKPLTAAEFIAIYLQISVPSALMLWLLHFCIIHTTQEGVGEMLHFGDRMFYSDWWNSLDMQQYYKKWNCVVGDWLYTYLYKDIGEVVFPGKKNLANFITFLISAFVHEWAYTVSTGVFCPIMTPMMLLGAFLSINFKVKMDQNFIHFFILSSFPLGPGILAMFMGLEHSARESFPAKTDELFVFWNNCLA